MSIPLAIIAVLSEAREKFGPPRTALERDEQAAYVRLRMRELLAGEAPPRPYQPQTFDATAARLTDNTTP